MRLKKDDGTGKLACQTQESESSLKCYVWADSIHWVNVDFRRIAPEGCGGKLRRDWDCKWQALLGDTAGTQRGCSTGGGVWRRPRLEGWREPPPMPLRLLACLVFPITTPYSFLLLYLHSLFHLKYSSSLPCPKWSLWVLDLSFTFPKKLFLITISQQCCHLKKFCNTTYTKCLGKITLHFANYFTYMEEPGTLQFFVFPLIPITYILYIVHQQMFSKG